MTTPVPVNGRCPSGYTYKAGRIGTAASCIAPVPVNGRCPSGFTYTAGKLGLVPSCTPTTSTRTTASAAPATSTVSTAVKSVASFFTSRSGTAASSGPAPKNGVCPAGYDYVQMGMSAACMPVSKMPSFDTTSAATQAAAPADARVTKCAPPMVLKDGTCVNPRKTPALVRTDALAPADVSEGGEQPAGVPKEVMWAAGIAAVGLTVWWVFLRKAT